MLNQETLEKIKAELGGDPLPELGLFFANKKFTDIIPTIGKLRAMGNFSPAKTNKSIWDSVAKSVSDTVAPIIPKAPVITVTKGELNASFTITPGAGDSVGSNTYTMYYTDGTTAKESAVGDVGTINNLTANKEYTFYVVATSTTGHKSPPSNVVKATPTVVTTVPGVPTLAMVAQAGAAKYTITAPASTGGTAITAYTIYYTDGTTPKTFNAALALTGTIPSLTAAKEYTFQVTAKNAKGESTKSTGVKATPTA